MSEPAVTRDTLRALAEMQGLELDDALADELLPQMQSTLDSIAALDELEPEQAAPASAFVPGSD